MKNKQTDLINKLWNSHTFLFFPRKQTGNSVNLNNREKQTDFTPVYKFIFLIELEKAFDVPLNFIFEGLQSGFL